MTTNVKVTTDDLFSGSEYVNTAFSGNEGYYNSFASLSADSCISFNLFKNKLKLCFNNYEDHSGIMSDKLNLCAIDLEKIDYLIGNNVTTSLENADDFDFEDVGEETNEDSIELVDLSNATYSYNVDIGNLALLSDSERYAVLKDLTSSLNTVSTNIQSNNNILSGVSENNLVRSLIKQYVQRIQSGGGSYSTNDLIKNNFYNDVVKTYEIHANVKITPNLLHYAGSHGYPLIRENVSDYNLQFAVGENPSIGQEYNFYKWGTVMGDEKTSPYSQTQFASTGSYQRKYSYYPDSKAYHYRTNEWYACDDGFYRDADGYIVCADKYNMGYTEDGTRRWVGQITSENAIIVDTPFGPAKVYDWCEEGNIDIYVHR